MNKLDKIIEIIKKNIISISKIIHDTNLENNNGIVGKNTSNDEVNKLDIIANKIFEDSFKKCKYIREYLSEEIPTKIKNIEYPNAPYMVAFDPIDGSKNVNINITTGTIFCIFKYDSNNNINSGRNIVCSGYSLFGPQLQLLLSKKNNTSLFYFNKDKFIESKILKSLPEKSPFYSINQGYYDILLNDKIKKYINFQLSYGKSLRFVGSMVADVHRTILKGGNFMYPCNSKNKNGKLRLLYEVYPMAFIFENLNGISCTDNLTPILDLEIPDNIHECSSVLLFNNKDYNEFISI